MNGFISFIENTTFTRALKFENASTVSLIGLSEIVFGLIIDVFLFHTIPDIYSSIGAIIIITGCIISIVK